MNTHRHNGAEVITLKETLSLMWTFVAQKGERVMTFINVFMSVRSNGCFNR